MFKRLNVKEWRQFSDVDIVFHEHLTVLTGANGAGKTTILNLLSKSTGWNPQFVSSCEKDERGVTKYFNSLKSLKSLGRRFFIKKETLDESAENKLGELEFDDGTIGDLVLPNSVKNGTYEIEIRKEKWRRESM